MALNDAAADAAIDTWVTSLSPAPADPVAIRNAMRPPVRAIYAGIVANAIVSPTGSPVMKDGGGNAVTGNGRIT